METDTQPELNKYFILYSPRKTLELVFTVDNNQFMQDKLISSQP